jgi:hypothetical protein
MKAHVTPIDWKKESSCAATGKYNWKRHEYRAGINDFVKSMKMG